MSTDPHLPVIFLMGPTASGKTDLATRLYERFDVELVSVDAAQVYRGMNIGTAKPDPDFLEKYPHHLIDIRNPDEAYSAANFRADALDLIADIHGRGKLPVLVGGTMFYFSALENGLSDLPPADDQVRAAIADELKQQGLSFIYDNLAKVDPDIVRKIKPTDTQRILRAMEIYRLTQQPPTAVMARSEAKKIPYPLIKMTIFTSDRRYLHERIALRFEIMIKQGLIEEVSELIKIIEQPESVASMKTVGYRQVIDYLEGEISYQEMIDQAVAATRQLAKRQLTWLRQQSNVVWFDIGHKQAPSAVEAYLNACCLSP